MKNTIIKASLLLIALISQAGIAQPGGGANTVLAREAAPIDLDGYWISLVTEDWMFRMVTPPKGAYRGVPLNREGRSVADTWNPEMDQTVGEACRAYGAPAIMRIPGRIKIDWEDDSTLRIETEAGAQTRIFNFGANNVEPEPGRQGFSQAEWEISAGGERHGNLKVVTGNLLPGYLRKNGVPYSEQAALTEYYSVYDAPNGDTWLVVTTEVADSQYLNVPFVTSTHFKKISIAEAENYWSPKQCLAQ